MCVLMFVGVHVFVCLFERDLELNRDCTIILIMSADGNFDNYKKTNEMLIQVLQMLFTRHALYVSYFVKTYHAWNV